MCCCVIGGDVGADGGKGLGNAVSRQLLLRGRIAYHDILRVDAALGHAALLIAVAAEADGLAALGGCGAGGGEAALGRGMAAEAQVGVEAAGGADAEAGAAVAAVVLDIAVGEGGRLKAVAVFGFGFFGGGDKAAFEIGVLLHIHPIAAIAGEEAALFGHRSMVGADLAVAEIAAAGHAVAHGDLGAALILAALVIGAVLQAFDVEALRIELDAAAEHLRAFEGGAAAALQGGGALAAADMAAEVGGFVAVAIAFAVVAAGGDAERDAVAEIERHAGIEAGLAVVALLLVALPGGVDVDLVFCGKAGAALAGDIGAADADIAVIELKLFISSSFKSIL